MGHHLGVSTMSELQKLIDYLADLEKADTEARADGDWNRVDFIGNCMDDTRARIAALSK
jgi:hypothetical protein